MSKSNISVKYKFPIEGLKWIPYVVGWVFGVFSLIFWLLILIVGVLSKDKHRFIDQNIHNVVYIYGVVIIALILIFLITGAFLISLLI